MAFEPDDPIGGLDAAALARFLAEPWNARIATVDGAGWPHVTPVWYELAREIATLEGVSGVWTAADYAGLGLPSPAEHDLVADAMFDAAPGYAFGDDGAGEDEHGPPKYLGTHGQRPGHADNAAFFLAAGAGIARGVALGSIRSRDVAPTVAAVLGIDMGPVEGAPLEPALS